MSRKHSNNFGFGFGLGAIIVFLGWGILLYNIDVSHEYMKNRVERTEALCKKLDSIPAGFDEVEVTCENGITLNYRD